MFEEAELEEKSLRNVKLRELEAFVGAGGCLHSNARVARVTKDSEYRMNEVRRRKMLLEMRNGRKYRG